MAHCRLKVDCSATSIASNRREICSLNCDIIYESTLSEVRAFAGDAPQADDQTIVVLQVES